MKGPKGAECLRRARERVLNVMLLTSLSIAIGGVVLRLTDRGMVPLPHERARQLAYLLLFALVISSVWIRVRMPRRPFETPVELADRFVMIRLISAVLAGLASPLGFALSWAIEPELGVVAPFWAAALGFNLLAYPHSRQVESLGLDGSDA